ncbi:MAG TPA: hypothetical protein VM468_00085 [Mycoplana sp.]|nr:hypothetical protein [Mycoplana sp.]
MLHKRTIRTMLAGIAMATLAGPAFAIDGADLVNKLNAASGSSGWAVSYGNIATDGNTVVLEGMKVKAVGGEAAADVGDVRLEGVEEDGSGGYTVETVRFPDFNKTEDGVTVTATALQIEGLAIPAKVESGTLSSMLMYDKASSGPLTVSRKGTEIFSVSGMQASVERMPDDAGLTYGATFSDIKADLTQVEDPKARETIEKLGMQTLAGEMTMKGSWALASGKLSLDEYALDFADVGRLGLSFAISGYTMDFINAMRQAMEASEANPNKDEANAALGMSMMGLMQQLTFDRAAISFADASLTRKVLEVVGAEQGVSAEQMAQSLKGLVPIMVAQLNMPELQNQIAEAVNTYLDDPKNLTVSAEPEKPVPFPMIMGAAMGAPNTIPKVLGVTVTANE